MKRILRLAFFFFLTNNGTPGPKNYFKSLDLVPQNSNYKYRSLIYLISGYIAV